MNRTVAVAGHKLQCEVADTPETRARGLLGRSYLCPDDGMLFVFDGERPIAMHTINMKMPIDMIFVRRDSTVGNVQHSVPAARHVCHLGMFVIETAAGWAKINGIRHGDRVTIE